MNRRRLKLEKGGPFDVSGTERLSLNIRMRKLCTFSDDCLKCGHYSNKSHFHYLESGKLLDDIRLCAFLDDDEKPRIGELHGVGGGVGRVHVVQVDGDVDVAALGDIDEGQIGSGDSVDGPEEVAVGESAEEKEPT